MKKQLHSCLTILFVAFLGSHALGQTINIKQRDSLLQVLQKPGLHDTVRIQANVGLATFYATKEDSINAKKYILEAEAIALNSKDANNIVWVYNKWTRLIQSKSETLQVLKKVEKYYPSIPEMSERRVRSFISLALMLEFYEEYAEALNVINNVVPQLEKRAHPERLLSLTFQTKEEIFSFLNDHEKAIACAKKSIEYAIISRDTGIITDSYIILAFAYNRAKKYEKTIETVEQVKSKFNPKDDATLAKLFEIKAECYYKANMHEEAIRFLEKDTTRPKGPMEPFYFIMTGESYRSLGKFDLAKLAFEQSRNIMKQSKLDSFYLSQYHSLLNYYTGKLAQDQERHFEAVSLLQIAVKDFSSDSSFHFRADRYWDALKALILSQRKIGNYEAASINQNTLIRSMQKELDEDAVLKSNLSVAHQQEELRIAEKASLEAKNTQQRRFLWGLGIGLAVMAGLGGVIWRQSKALGVEKKKSEALLLNMLPDTIASRMKLGEHSIADYFEEATVIFIDMVGFTQLSSESSPKEVVKLLNHLFSKIDQLTGAYGLEKIKTIGDCYMAVAGIPIPSKNHLETALQFCKAVLDELDGFEHEGRKIHFKIGVETGPAVAGIIGERRFLFDLWGDTVNMASRMESNGVPSAIQVTANVFEKMKDQFPFEPRGVVEIKGKGGVEVFLMWKEG